MKKYTAITVYVIILHCKTSSLKNVDRMNSVALQDVYRYLISNTKIQYDVMLGDRFSLLT